MSDAVALAVAMLWRALPIVRPRCAVLVAGWVVERDGSEVWRPREDVARPEIKA